MGEEQGARWKRGRSVDLQTRSENCAKSFVTNVANRGWRRDVAGVRSGRPGSGEQAVLVERMRARPCCGIIVSLDLFVSISMNRDVVEIKGAQRTLTTQCRKARRWPQMLVRRLHRAAGTSRSTERLGRGLKLRWRQRDGLCVFRVFRIVIFDGLITLLSFQRSASRQLRQGIIDEWNEKFLTSLINLTQKKTRCWLDSAEFSLRTVNEHTLLFDVAILDARVEISSTKL